MPAPSALLTDRGCGHATAPETNCAICGRPIERDRLTELATCAELHFACVGDQLPQDALVALLGALALVLAPAILLWAG